jgi:hypothetical protein
MSSFIMRNESIAALATMLDRSVNAARWAGRVRYGLYNGNDLYSLINQEYTAMTGRRTADLDAYKIFNVLRCMNEKATGQRYNDVQPYEFMDMPKGEWCAMAESNPFQLLKTFECYLYQCDEGDVSKCDLFIALRKSCNYYMKHLIGKLPAYAEADWG